MVTQIGSSKGNLFSVVVICLAITTLPFNFVFGKQDSLDTMRRWCDAFRGSDIEVSVSWQESPQARLMHGKEEFYVSEDQTAFIARRFIIANSKATGTDIWGLLNEQHLTIDWSEVVSGKSGGSVSLWKDDAKASKLLNMMCSRHLILNSGAYGSELLPVLQRCTVWESQKIEGRTQFESKTSDGNFSIVVDDVNLGWPVKLSSQQFISDKDFGDLEFLVEIKFEQPKKFAGYEIDLPSKVTSRISTRGEKLNNVSNETIVVDSINKRTKEPRNWSDLLHEMPDGLEVSVTEFPKIRHEWRGNEIVVAPR